jgi:lipopolysaccharide transport system permease protein
MLNTLIKFFKQRDLIIQFTKRELEIRHKGSLLGHLWAILSPSMMLGLYLFIFGVIFGGRFGILPNEDFFDYALALFLGLSFFNVIAEAITTSPLLIISQPNFVKKVVFPLEIIPLTKIAASLYYSFLSVALCILLAPFTHGGLHASAFALPLLMLPLAMIALGISWALSAIGVFIRDINHLTGFIATATMYASAIVYSPTKVPMKIWSILKLNPLLLVIDQARHIILWNSTLDYFSLIYIYVISLIILIGGYIIFKYLRPYFAELI